MKILCIGDIHGRTSWKQIVQKEFDIVVFIGDYLDSRDDVSPIDQVNNLREIVEFKLNNLDKVKLLIGNHDYHYMRGISENYSGYIPSIRFDAEEIFSNNVHLFQACFEYRDYLFTHAGVTKTWYNSAKSCFLDRGIDIGNFSTEEVINILFDSKPDMFKFTPGVKYDSYGDDVTQTPIWVRPESLMVDRLDNYYHVVGHTFGNPEIVEDSNLGGIIKIDCLGLDQYLEINTDRGVLGTNTSDQILFMKV